MPLWAGRSYCGQMTIAGIALVVGGIALVVLGAIARGGKLPRQSVAGLRTKATLASDETWEAAQGAGANWVIGAGAILCVGGVLAMLVDSETTGDVVALIATALMLIPLVIGFRKGQVAAQAAFTRQCERSAPPACAPTCADMRRCGFRSFVRWTVRNQRGRHRSWF